MDSFVCMVGCWPHNGILSFKSGVTPADLLAASLAAVVFSSTYLQIIISVRKRSCEKVMFSQACVKNSVHRGDCVSQHALGQTPPGQTPPWADTPQQTVNVNAADGTHPTGMHSCSINLITLQNEKFNKSPHEDYIRMYGKCILPENIVKLL